MDDRLELRKYSVFEIDALRAACMRKVTTGRYREPDIHNLSGPVAEVYDRESMKMTSRSAPIFSGGMSIEDHKAQDQRHRIIAEEMVRTHMLASHTAEDLIASEIPPLEADVSTAARRMDA